MPAWETAAAVAVLIGLPAGLAATIHQITKPVPAPEPSTRDDRDTDR